MSRLFEHAVVSICISIFRMMNDLSSHVFIYVLTHVFIYADQMNASWISEGPSAKHTSDGHNATLATTCFASSRGCALPPERPNRQTRTRTLGAEANQRAATVGIGVDGIFTRARRIQSLNNSMTMRHFLGTDPFSNCSNMRLSQ